MGKNIKYVEDIVTFPATMGNSQTLYSDVYDIPGNNGEVLLDAQAVNSEKITANFNIGVENVSTGVSGGEFTGVVSGSITQLTATNVFSVKLYGIGWTSPNTGRNDLADADAVNVTVSTAANVANKDIDLLCIALNNMLRATTYITTGEYAGSVLSDFIEFYKTGDLKIACRTLKTGAFTGVTLTDVTGTPIADLGMTVGTQIGSSYEYSTLTTDGTIASNVAAASVTGATAPLMAGTVSLGAQVAGTDATYGYQEITNTGILGTFAGAAVPTIANATYDLDITVDGGALRQTATALLTTDDWDGVCAKIQAALRALTLSTETIAIVGGAIRVTSATTGITSSILIAAGTAGSGGGDLLTAIDALATDYATTIPAPVAGVAATAGTQTITNTGTADGGTFTGATVPGIATQANYELDVTIDGTGPYQLVDISIDILDDWDDICAAIQASIRTATSSTETCVIDTGKIRVTSASTGVTSAVLIAAGTNGGGSGDLLAVIDAVGGGAGYTPSIDGAVAGTNATAGVGTVTNTGALGTFASAAVPGIATHADWELDITIDGGGLNQLDDIDIDITDDWDAVAAAIQVSLRTATVSTETVAIVGGVLTVTSATTGAASAVLIAAGTSGGGSGDLLAAIDALSTNYTPAISAAVPGVNGTYTTLTVDLGASKADADVTNLVAATTYTATITDNLTGAMAISILGSAASTVADLVTEINTDLTGVTATHADPSQYIVITHDTIGVAQTLVAADTTLFTTLFHEVTAGDTFEISFTGDGWPITILDYNASTNPTGLGPYTFTISASAAADTVVANLVAQLETDWATAVTDKDANPAATLGTYLQWTVSGGKVKLSTKTGYYGTDNSFTLTDGGTALNTGLVIADGTYTGTGGTDTSLIALNSSTITIGDAIRIKAVTDASGALATGHGITIDAAFVGPEMQPVEGSRSVKSYTNLLNNGITFSAGSYIVSDAIEVGNYNSKVIASVRFTDISKITATVKIKLQTTFGVKVETTITEDSDYIVTSYTAVGATWYDITDTPTTLTAGTGSAIYLHSETTRIARFVRAKIYDFDGTGAIAADSGIDLMIQLQG